MLKESVVHLLKPRMQCHYSLMLKSALRILSTISDHTIFDSDHDMIWDQMHLKAFFSSQEPLSTPIMIWYGIKCMWKPETITSIEYMLYITWNSRWLCLIFQIKQQQHSSVIVDILNLPVISCGVRLTHKYLRFQTAARYLCKYKYTLVVTK